MAELSRGGGSPQELELSGGLSQEEGPPALSPNPAMLSAAWNPARISSLPSPPELQPLPASLQ